MRPRPPIIGAALLVTAALLPLHAQTRAPSATRGAALLAFTRDSLPSHVGNGLRCFSCHLNAGRGPGGLPLTGVVYRYPVYNDRRGATMTIEDRVNECFRRSMAGEAIDDRSREMRDIVAYFTSLSPAALADSARRTKGLVPIADLPADRAVGKRLFAAKCAVCHGADGQGIAPVPALWGPRSFAIAAGMARRTRFATFIAGNMPLGGPRLTDDEARAITAYVLSHPRPDTPGKERDFPKGRVPTDLPYTVLSSAKSSP